MAVYTHVDDEALSGFLAAYDVGGLLSAKGIAEGVENTNYLIRADKGTFILTLYEQRVSAGDLPFFLGLLAHCADKGLAAPHPVARRDGATISQLCGRPAAMVTFLDGVAVRRPQPAQCRELGMGLGTLMLKSLLQRDICKDVERIQTTITRSNAASWKLFRKFAKQQDARLSSQAYFGEALHFRGKHNTEYMVTIDLAEELKKAA